MLMQSLAPWDQVEQSPLPWRAQPYASYEMDLDRRRLRAPTLAARPLHSLLVTITDSLSVIVFGALSAIVGYALSILAFPRPQTAQTTQSPKCFTPAIILLVLPFSLSSSGGL